jgi:hypothetical protein
VTRKQIGEFETLQGQLESFHAEMNALVKKNPNDPLNKFKLGLINSVLTKANAFLGNPRRPFKDFETFEEEAMPSTSDVLMIISQYLSAFEKVRADNIYQKAMRWVWQCEDGGEDIRTAPPKKLEN